MTFTLEDFVRESNRIEGIVREPTTNEMLAYTKFLLLDKITADDLGMLVEFIEPGARLRDKVGLDVRVGSHIAPLGGPGILGRLATILAHMHKHGPYKTHLAYEALHPFTDGNGRSGRALWLWMMGGIEKAPLGFLHHWYYLSLQAGR